MSKYLDETGLKQLIQKLNLTKNMDNILKPSVSTIPSNTNNYHSLWDTLVSNGYCTRTLIETVNSLPIYEYDFINNKNIIIDVSGTQKISNNVELYNKPKIALISGLHGDERATPLFLYEFMNNLCKKYNEIFVSYDWYVIPLANPTGYNSNTRNNYNNVNINRDFGDFATLEANAIKTMIDARDYEFIVDIHQSNAGGTNGATDRPNIAAYLSLPYNEDSEKEDFIYKKFMQSAMRTQADLCKYYSLTNNIQTFFPWEGTNTECLRNYGKTHANYTVCYELSRCCYRYSNSTTDFNSIALVVGNTLTDNFLKNILNSKM